MVQKSLVLIYPAAIQRRIPALERLPFQEILGITVHYTASRTLEGALRSMEVDKLGYHVVIDRDGRAYQTCYFSNRVAHAGEASWHGISPNRNHLAVAFVSWGLLDEGKKDGPGESYAGVKIDPKDIRTDKKGRKWEIATPLQESSLLNFLNWACLHFKIDPENICGHDECATPSGRKVDPGGSLSMSMSSIRQSIKK